MLHLTTNSDVYNDDNKKIAFILSFLTGGAAKAWKEVFVNNHSKADGGLESLGKIGDFFNLFKAAFSASDVPGNAKAELRNLKQTGSADEYVSQFRVISGRTGIKEDAALIEYFMEGLRPKLLDKIFSLPTMPTTITKWYEHASRFDNQYNRVREIISRNHGTTYR